MTVISPSERPGWLYRYVLIRNRTRHTFAAEIQKARFLVVFGLMLWATWYLGHLRPVEVASNAVWDAIELEVARRNPDLRERVEIIEITDGDYKSLFKEISPLDPVPLARLVAMVLHQQNKDSDTEKVILDIDTSGKQFDDLATTIALLLNCLDEEGCANPSEGPAKQFVDRVKTRVLFARGATPQADGETFSLRHVLGTKGQLSAHIAHSAPVILRPDLDGRLRRIKPYIKVGNDAVVSMSVAAQPGLSIENALATAGKWGNGREIRLALLPYLTQLRATAAGEFLTGPHSLTGKTVFIGGRYSAADEFYMADGRQHSGVHVLAAASLALADGEDIYEAPPAIEFTLKVLLAVLVTVIHHWLRPVAAFGLTGLGMTALVTAAASAGFALGFVLNMAAFLVGIGLEQSVEGAINSDETLRNLEDKLASSAGT